MKETTKNQASTTKKWKQLFLTVPVFILVSFAMLVTIIQIPAIQTKILGTLIDQIASKTDYKIDIGYTNLMWFDRVIIKEVKISDSQDSILMDTDKVSANIHLYDLIINKKIHFEEIEFTRPEVHVLKKSDSTSINISEFIYQIRRRNVKKKKSSILRINSVKVLDGLFTYNDMTKPVMEKGKDHNHFGYRSIYSQLNEFEQYSDTVNFQFSYLQAFDLKNELNLRSLEGDFQYCNKSMTLAKMNLRTNKSLIRDSIRLNYPSPNALKYFVDSVSFFVNLDSSFIYSDEIALFAPAIKHLDQLYAITGQLNGTIGYLTAKNLDLSFGQNTSIDGDFSFFGLPKIRETFIDINCKEAILEPKDVVRYVPKRYHSRIRNTGKVNFKGQFLGFPTDFVSNGTFDTESGFIESDINFKLAEDNTAFYSGNLKLERFDLGKILNKEKVFQEIYLNGDIKGHGLELNNANFHLNADIDTIGIRGYDYSNIHTNGELANGYFEGELEAKDPNLAFDGQVRIDVRNNIDKINITACLDTLRLQPLGFSNQNIFISSHINIDMTGFNIDSLKGFANLQGFKFQIDEKKIELDSIKFLSFLVAEQRVITLDTDGLTAEVKGDFKNSTVLSEIKRLNTELELLAQNNRDSLESYYDNLVPKDENFELDIKVNLWDANRFVQPFFSQVSLSKNIVLEGKFISGNTSILSLNTRWDSLRIYDSYMLNNLVDINISKRKITENILSSFFISSKEQYWNEDTKTDNIYLESIWSNKQIDIEFNLDQKEFENQIDIKANIDFLEDSISFRFLPSELQVLGEKWHFDTTNLITSIDERLIFENISLLHQDQSLSVNGILSNLTSDQLQTDIRNFDVTTLNAILPIDISGTIDGNIDINKLENDILIESNLGVNAFYIEDFLVGNIDCFSDWENNRDRLYLELTVNRTGKRIIDINGHFYPNNELNQLQLRADFDSANLNIIQPFVVNNFTNLSGLASGNFDISGNPDSPILSNSKDEQGKAIEGRISDGNITINYTNTSYKFSSGINIEENQIGVNNLELLDRQNNTATFNGGIFHDGFRHFVLDISGKYENFEMLNTGPKDNKLYYGSAYATGDISVLGATNNLTVSAHAKTAKGTRISIPIGEISDYNIEQKEYISFVDLSHPENEKRLQEVVKEEIDLKGLKLDFDIEVTNEAYTELIFDVKAGDIIRGRGNGNIELLIDPYGDFNMFGDLQIESGGYNFTLYNIINKEFDIQRGSSISWYGDPYRAKLNITAKYRQLASLTPILSTTYADNPSPELRKKYPSIVDLYLKGNLLSPEIRFDINIDEYPSNITTPEGVTIPLDTEISAFKSRLLANEQELKRQVFSLVILRKFSPENSFSVNSQTIGNSFSEFVSNQLSYWATQVDENLEVDVDLAGLNQDAFNTFQLRLSYSFLDGRLKVTRGGSLSDQETNNTDLSTIIGDWTVEYLLTQDGRFRAKMYSRSNLSSSFNNVIGDNSTETGFSLQFVRSFDDLKNILIEARKENQSDEPSDSNRTKAQGTIREEEPILRSK
jgi:hypothetical protein